MKKHNHNLFYEVTIGSIFGRDFILEAKFGCTLCNYEQILPNELEECLHSIEQRKRKSGRN